MREYTVVQLVEALWVRFAMGSLRFFTDLIFRGCINAVGSIQSVTKVTDSMEQSPS